MTSPASKRQRVSQSMFQEASGKDCPKTILAVHVSNAGQQRAASPAPAETPTSRRKGLLSKLYDSLGSGSSAPSRQVQSGSQLEQASSALSSALRPLVSRPLPARRSHRRTLQSLTGGAPGYCRYISPLQLARERQLQDPRPRS